MNEERISKEEVKKLGQLARIDIEEGEIDNFRRGLERILDFISVLKKAQVEEDGKEAGGPANIFRDSASPQKPAEYTEELIKQAPDSKNGFVKVKKIL